MLTHSDPQVNEMALDAKITVQLFLERDLIGLRGFYPYAAVHELTCAQELIFNDDETVKALWLQIGLRFLIPLRFIALFEIHDRKTREPRLIFLPPDALLSFRGPELFVLCVFSRGYDPFTLRCAFDWLNDDDDDEPFANKVDTLAQWNDDVMRLLIIKYFCPTTQDLVTLGCFYCNAFEDSFDSMRQDDWMEKRLQPFLITKVIAPMTDELELSCCFWMESCNKRSHHIVQRIVTNSFDKEGMRTGDVVIWQPLPAEPHSPATRALTVQDYARKLATESTQSTAEENMQGLNFEEEMKLVVFHLAEGQSLYFDKRLLVARSEFFRDMLVTSSCRESQTGEVDLSMEALATRSSMTALLRFIVSDTFTAKGDADLAFEVRFLADRYRLQHLVSLADAELLALLSKNNALSFLGRTFGSDSELESACWTLVEEEAYSILELQSEALGDLVRENPALAKELLLRTVRGSGHKRRRVTGTMMCNSHSLPLS